MTRIAMVAFLLSSYGMAQAIAKGNTDPVFTFTPAHGNPTTGKFSPGGSLSFIDQFEGTPYSIELGKIERIVMTARKPDNSKCSNSSKVVIYFTDGTRQHGCFAPAPLAFMGAPGSIPSVNSMIGKFVRVSK